MDSFNLQPQYDIVIKWFAKEGLEYVEILMCRNNRVMDDFLKLKKYFIEINPSLYMVNPIYWAGQIWDLFHARYCCHLLNYPLYDFDTSAIKVVNSEFSSEDDDFEDEEYTDEKINQVLRRIPPIGYSLSSGAIYPTSDGWIINIDNLES